MYLRGKVRNDQNFHKIDIFEVLSILFKLVVKWLSTGPEMLRQNVAMPCMLMEIGVSQRDERHVGLFR